MENKPVLTHYDTASRLITDKPARVYWIFVRAVTLGTVGTVIVYDGWDTTGTIKISLVVGYNRVNPFVPPFSCAKGLYISMDGAVTSYTVGWLPESVALRE